MQAAQILQANDGPPEGLQRLLNALAEGLIEQPLLDLRIDDGGKLRFVQVGGKAVEKERPGFRVVLERGVHQRREFLDDRIGGMEMGLELLGNHRFTSV